MSATIELIKNDHRKVEQLFSEFRQSKSNEVAEQICTELTVHARLEEELLYPLLREKVDRGDAEHAQEEHDEAKAIIAQILESDASGEELVQLVEKLEKSISHHVKEEESEVLPEMEEKLGDQLEQLYDTVVQRKQELIEEEEQDEELLDLAKSETEARVQAEKSES